MVELINNIDLILNSFLSGFLFIGIYVYMTSIKIDSGNMIIASVVVSYMIKNTLTALHLFILNSVVFTNEINIVITLLFSILLAFLTVRIVNSKIFRKALNKLSHKTIYNNIWNDIIDYEKGIILRMYLKNGIIYTGKLYKHEENGNNSWFVLKDYTFEDENCRYDTEGTDLNSMVVINLQEINRIETF